MELALCAAGFQQREWDCIGSVALEFVGLGVQVLLALSSMGLWFAWTANLLHFFNKDLHREIKEIMIRSPTKVSSLGSR